MSDGGPKEKPILVLDFDGVVHSYEKGWQDGSIYGTVTPGFFNWAVEAYKHFKLVIYSSRSKTPEGREAMETWLRTFIIPWRHEQMDRGTPNAKAELVFEYAHEKPPAWITIDDRAVTFSGRWDMPYLNPTELLNFKPWTEPQVLYQLPESLGQPDAQQQGSRVAPPLDAVRKCPKHPWMTRQNQDGSRDCMVSTCNWTAPAPP